jgi:hypothetical protein
LKVIYFFLKFPYDYYGLKDLLKSFLDSRGILCNISTIYLSNFSFDGLNILFLNFIRSDFYVLSILNCRELQFYKLKLKILLKTSFNKQIILVLFLINIQIMRWLQYTSFLSNKKKLYLELDIYIYKLFWKHLKKRHPKKPNTWIYLMYWGNFSGLCKFFVFDSNLNKFIFLKSHISLLDNYKINNYKIYNSLNSFNLYNSIKLNQIIFKKFELGYLPNYTVFYEKQRGLCVICKKPICLANFKILYLKKNNYSLFQNLLLVHLYCNFENSLVIILEIY